MADVDDLMQKCPLKHEIRVKFWAPFIRKLKRAPISYLTLYSPPLMDVKYFNHCGYIKAVNGKYSDVVGVTVDKDAFADSNSSLDNRLELLLPGNINDLLNGKNKSTFAKQLESKFPFDVINLDYTDALHKYSIELELSPHFQAIETILKKQKTKDKYTLFLTTYVDLNIYNENFLNDLKEILDDNIKNTVGFYEKFQAVCNCENATEFMKTNSNNFFVISLLKYILLFLKDYGYTLKEAGIKWIVRDAKEPTRSMLHLAFLIETFVPVPASGRKIVGKRINKVEEESIKYIKDVYSSIAESTDYDNLFERHSVQINDFNNRTFELDVPEPKSE